MREEAEEREGESFLRDLRPAFRLGNVTLSLELFFRNILSFLVLISFSFVLTLIYLIHVLTCKNLTLSHTFAIVFLQSVCNARRRVYSLDLFYLYFAAFYHPTFIYGTRKYCHFSLSVADTADARQDEWPLQHRGRRWLLTCKK